MTTSCLLISLSKLTFAQQLSFASFVWINSSSSTNVLRCGHIYRCSAKFCKLNVVVSIGIHSNRNFAFGLNISQHANFALSEWIVDLFTYEIMLKFH